jgi:serine/threonine protein kinase
MDRLRPSDPENIGPYKLIARLGAGGMGVVFLGTKGTDRAAIKVVRNSFLDDPSLKTRFVREIETLKKIDSPYVAKIVDSSVEEELSWHAVEFVNGPTLRELVDTNGPLTEVLWWELAHQLGEALAAVHRLGIVHRDIKPANIIMSDTGPKIIDFGISQDSDATSLTMTGTVAGSPAWLSPEQLEGVAVTAGSDLYSLGSVLVFAATGQSPWGSETSMSIPAVHQKILTGEPNLDGLSDRQKDLIQALQKSDPSARSSSTGSPPLSALTSDVSPPPVSAKINPEPLTKEKTSKAVGAFIALGVAATLVFVLVALAVGDSLPSQRAKSIASQGGDSIASEGSGAVGSEPTAQPIEGYLAFEPVLTATLEPIDGETVYIADTFIRPVSGQLVVVDREIRGDSTRLHLIDSETMAPIASFSYEKRYLELSSMSPDGRVAAFDLRDMTTRPWTYSLILIDLETGQVLQEYARDDSIAQRISAFSGGGSQSAENYFYFTNFYGPDCTLDERVYKAQWESENPTDAVSSFFAGRSPWNLTVAGSRLLVKNNGCDEDGFEGSLTVVDRKTDRAQEELDTGATGVGFLVSPDERFVYFLDGSALQSLDLESLETRRIIDTPFWTNEVALSPDGRLIAVLSPNGQGGFLVFDIASGQIAQVVEDFLVEAWPRGISFSADGSRILIGTFGTSESTIVAFERPSS